MADERKDHLWKVQEADEKMEDLVSSQNPVGLDVGTSKVVSARKKGKGVETAMDCIIFTPNAEEADLRAQFKAPAKNLTQDLYVANDLKTGRVMVKDEDVCLHCGLCAERCPTGAWDMQKYLLDMTHAGNSCRPQTRSAA